jgi:hypothetical protein
MSITAYHDIVLMNSEIIQIIACVIRFYEQFQQYLDRFAFLGGEFCPFCEKYFENTIFYHKFPVFGRNILPPPKKKKNSKKLAPKRHNCTQEERVLKILLPSCF